MAAITFSTPTSSLVGTDNYDLSLKLFAGEIISEFEAASKMLPLTRTREMPEGGDSVQFPALGTAGTKYHASGMNILTEAGYLQEIEGGERLIYADRECLSPTFIPKFEERIAHFGFRAEYAKKLGYALAKNSDQMIMRTLALAAAASATVNGGPAGQGLTTGSATVTATEILDFLLDTQTAMSEDDVPMEDRYCLLTPATMQVLFASDAAKAYLDMDFVGTAGNGDFRGGVIGRIAGFDIVQSNHFNGASLGNYTGTSDSQITASKQNDYDVDMTKYKGLCFHKDAVGTAVSANVSLEHEYKMEYRGDIVVASYQMGHGILRPECAAAFTAL